MPKHNFEQMTLTRIVANPDALDALSVAADALALRTAGDELLVYPAQAVDLNDPYAIVVPDGAWTGAWVSAAVSAEIMARHAEWEAPQQRPAFAQGSLAGIPTKLWFEAERTLILVALQYSAEMEARLAH